VSFSHFDEPSSIEGYDQHLKTYPQNFVSSMKSNEFSTLGTVMFHVRRKPADFFPRKRKKKPMLKDFASESALVSDDKMPYLLEMNPGRLNSNLLDC
jgi:hypothetical protein